MNRLKKLTSVFVLSGVAVGGWMVGNGIVADVQFARAEAQVQTSRQQLATAQDLSSAFREVGKVVEPSVVRIDVRKTVKGIGRSLPFGDDEMLKRMFPDRDGDGEPDLPEGFGDKEFDQAGTGSGVIMEVDGSTAYILTNNHVAGGAEEMVITFSDGRQIKNGKVLGTDEKTDLAVVKIELDHVIAAKWGNSGDVQKGDWIVAFGSPFGYVGSMTHGIVSALNRQTSANGGSGILGRFGYENFIQVDAPINPGNSGGPLVNLHGEVIGINTAIASRSGGFQGIGFAIPSNQAKTVFAQLKTSGKVVRGWLGVGIASVNDPRVNKTAESFGYSKNEGVLVQEVMPNTPATGKLRNGDIVTAINGKPVKDVQELRNHIAEVAPNTEVTLNVFRDGKTEDVKLKVGEQPDDLRLASGKGGRNSGGSGSNDAADKEDAGVKGKIGIGLGDPNEELAQKFGFDASQKGAVVVEVDPKSPAYREGIRPGDVITEVGKQQVKNAKEARDALTKADLTKGVRLYVVSREGARFVFISADSK
ncbi:MAG: serine protease Do [Phycisphaerales bacterium]|jgi:serine protease Do|nr:serine protease Do [Phycisphaerales bacterium]